MVAALYSSRESGTKDFVNNGVHFGWDTVEDVYRVDLMTCIKGYFKDAQLLLF